jgi:hypothetical protein
MAEVEAARSNELLDQVCAEVRSAHRTGLAEGRGPGSRQSGENTWRHNGKAHSTGLRVVGRIKRHGIRGEGMAIQMREEMREREMLRERC